MPEGQKNKKKIFSFANRHKGRGLSVCYILADRIQPNPPQVKLPRITDGSIHGKIIFGWLTRIFGFLDFGKKNTLGRGAAHIRKYFILVSPTRIAHDRYSEKASYFMLLTPGPHRSLEKQAKTLRQKQIQRKVESESRMMGDHLVRFGEGSSTNAFNMCLGKNKYIYIYISTLFNCMKG